MDLGESLNHFMHEKTVNLTVKEWSEEETICEQLFVDTTRRNEDGRFVVRLPTKVCVEQLGESKTLALDKLLRLEKRFEKNSQLRTDYNNFMEDYLASGHMEKVEENLSSDNPVFYFPHHPVLRPDNITTKLRTVFNGSAHTSTGLSLNDVLMSGPTIQQDLFNILLRFRCHRYAMTADIKKMFRQILIHDSDRQLQLILWRFSPEEAVVTYRLNTVTYGTCSAPFAAARCLRQLSLEYEDQYPHTSQVIIMDFYMDDVLTGDDELEKLIRTKEELSTVLQSAGFELHKWKANDPSIVPEDESTSAVKILGMQWETRNDMFGFKVDVNVNAKITKRNVLSEVQKIFDPLGVISPIVLHGKLIMQEIWSAKLDWDQKLPEKIEKEWIWFCKQVDAIQHVSFPRHVPSKGTLVELHGFSDAAKRAYGAVIYVRTVCAEGVYVSLLCSKSRIAPCSEKANKEDITIPRMELRAATLLVELMAKVREALSVQIHGIYYWTDSMVTIDWINNPNRKRPTFVSNRVKKINEMSPIENWNHVRSNDNPADLISRGTSTLKLSDSSIWWNGPGFLRDRDSPWSNVSIKTLVNQNQPQRSAKKCPQDIQEYSLLDRFSKLKKLQRVTAYCLRFRRNCKTKEQERSKGLLTIQELEDAQLCLTRMAQNKMFAAEIQLLQKNKPLPSSSSLITLQPFLDDRQVLRVGGRIQAAGVSFDQQHPIILSAKCKLAQLLAVQLHVENLHVGSQGLLYTMRMKYWPIHGRNLTRRVVHQCMNCFRNKPKPISQIMGQLPIERVNPGRPFETCGIDFGGPITAKEVFVRTQKTHKIYFALFICLRTRAVHLELVSGLSTTDFIAALRRFAGQRGWAKTIYCDNATNFVGSKNEIKALAESFNYQVAPDIQEFCKTQGVEWKFIPPRSPAFGGIWEAGIKSVKQHIRRVLGPTIPTYEEMLTLLKQIEGCLNSRPISPMSSDPRDPNPLTPGHFLVGGPINSPPDRNYAELKSNRLTRYEQIQKSLQSFWERWRLEYLNTMQQRTKKMCSTEPDLLVGQLCLIKEDNLPPYTWITGRVIKVHPGPDGRVRVATLMTTKGELKRSIAKLCLLPFEGNNGEGEHVED